MLWDPRYDVFTFSHLLLHSYVLRISGLPHDPNVVHSRSITGRLSVQRTVFLFQAILSIGFGAFERVPHCIGIVSGTDFYHRYNEWLYMSVHGQLLIITLCFATWLLAPEKRNLFSLVHWLEMALAWLSRGILIDDRSWKKPGKAEIGKGNC